MPRARSELIVLGNGPSLRKTDFSDFKGHDTLGMNAAYRYWDRIDWRPTYYTCLDDALIDTHKNDIQRLVDEARISGFFLSGRMLDHFPELASDTRVSFLDEYVAHWHRVRGTKYGLIFREHAAFSTSAPDMLTTGSYSVRFGASLGYETIRLFGIDLVYEPLEVASATDGNRLVMDLTPTTNPNYFFDDYQRAGDQFHVPNPAQHSTDLHLQSFITLRDDFIRNRVPARLINANTESRLNTEAILPCEDQLPTVTMEQKPTPDLVILADADQHEHILNLLWLWEQTAFYPILGTPMVPRPDLIFLCQTPLDASVEPRIRARLAGSPELSGCFGDVRFVKSYPSRTQHGQAVGAAEEQTPSELNSAGLTDTKVGLQEQHDVYFMLDSHSLPLRCDWLRSTQSGKETTVVAELPDTAFRDSQTLTATIAEMLGGKPDIAFVRSSRLPVLLEKLRKKNTAPSLFALLVGNSVKRSGISAAALTDAQTRSPQAKFATIRWAGIRNIRRILSVLKRNTQK